MVDYQSLRTQLTEAVPFARHAGVEITEIGDGFAAAQIVQSGALSNHLGSIHAGAIFTLGETASGAAMLGTFAEIATRIRPLAISANISYLKLARGTITAQARTDVAGTELRSQMNADGLAKFEVHVDVQDDRQRAIAKLTVAWRVTMPKAASV
jgi:uncharacterized protein (TIGR00369 family)